MGIQGRQGKEGAGEGLGTGYLGPGCGWGGVEKDMDIC